MYNPKVILIRNAQPYDFGGGERFPVFLADILRRNEIESIIISRNPKLLDYARKLNIPTIHGLWWSNQHWSGARVLLFPIYALWQVLLFLWYWRLFIHLKPTTVHIQSKDDFIAATYAAKKVGATVVWTDHADLKHVWLNLQAPFKNPIGKWIYKAAKNADSITVVSRSEYNEVTKHLPTSGDVQSKIEIVHNGVSDSYASYQNIPLREKFTFCVLGRLVTDKGISEAIKAFSVILGEHPDAELMFIGDGPEREKFKQQASTIQGVTFAGYQSDPLSLVASCHALLQPTYHEGFSVTLVEASMLMKPIIATSVGGNVEIIKDQETGLLVPAQDSKALADAMNALMNDDKLRQRLAENARAQYLERFVFDKIVKERFMKLYEKTTD